MANPNGRKAAMLFAAACRRFYADAMPPPTRLANLRDNL
jgi:hypothetical protein